MVDDVVFLFVFVTDTSDSEWNDDDHACYAVEARTRGWWGMPHHVAWPISDFSAQRRGLVRSLLAVGSVLLQVMFVVMVVVQSTKVVAGRLSSLDRHLFQAQAATKFKI
jgi:hypothetical protein